MKKPFNIISGILTLMSFGLSPSYRNLSHQFVISSVLPCEKSFPASIIRSLATISVEMTMETITIETTNKAMTLETIH